MTEILMLDTNICSYIMNKPSPELLAHLDNADPESLYISSITLAELEYGVANNPQYKEKVSSFLKRITVIDFDRKAAKHYGDIRLSLKTSPIGANDCLIAAHARSLGAILVTHNMKEFKRVPKLRLEDWAIKS